MENLPDFLITFWNLLKDIAQSDKLISVGAFIVSVVVATMNIKTTKNNLRNQTIDQYRRLSDKAIKGPFYWLYHMDINEFEEIKAIALQDHDTNRKRDSENFEKFTKLEDNLGEIDEFASGIITKLYDYKTFKALALNYCRKRVVPRIDDVLKGYNNNLNSYKSLRYLVLRMKMDYHKIEKKELIEYKNKLKKSEENLHSLDKKKKEEIKKENANIQEYKKKIEKLEKSLKQESSDRKELKEALKRCK